MLKKHLDEDFMNSITPYELKFQDKHNISVQGMMFHFGDTYNRNRFLLNTYLQHRLGVLKPRQSNLTIEDFNGHTLIDSGFNIAERFTPEEVRSAKFAQTVSRHMGVNKCLLAEPVDSTCIEVVDKNRYKEVLRFTDTPTHTTDKKVYVCGQGKLVYTDPKRWPWVPLDCFLKGYRDDKKRVIVSEQYYSPYLY